MASGPPRGAGPRAAHLLQLLIEASRSCRLSELTLAVRGPAQPSSLELPPLVARPASSRLPRHASSRQFSTVRGLTSTHASASGAAQPPAGVGNGENSISPAARPRGPKPGRDQAAARLGALAARRVNGRGRRARCASSRRDFAAAPNSERQDTSFFW